MPKITIERPYEWNNQKKKIDVYIDNTKVGQIGINETAHFAVDADKHTIMLKNNWPTRAAIIEVDMSDSQNKTIKMSTSKWTPWIGIITILLLLPITTLLQQFFNIESLWSFKVAIYGLMMIIAFFVISRIETLKLQNMD